MKTIHGDNCHELLAKKIKGKLSFNDGVDYSKWKGQVRDKLLELVGIKNISANACPLNVAIEKQEKKQGYTQTRFVFESEKGAIVPCYLLVPDIGKDKYPVVITLQGHSSGFHNSIGEPKTQEEEEYALGRGQFAVQAVKRGFVALAIEQRAMGERASTRHTFAELMCTFPALTAIQLGRTVLGERMWDVSKAIDALSMFPVCDLENIVITGNSGGGTASFYCACYDERIKMSVPSCAFCSYETSIMNVYHCACNYIPRAMEWFEMQDLACLIAPRKLVVVAGEKDVIFPLHGVRTAFETVQKIYGLEKAEQQCDLIETSFGHWWCEDIIWSQICKEIRK